jgi:hypothetical protein
MAERFLIAVALAAAFTAVVLLTAHALDRMFEVNQ